MDIIEPVKRYYDKIAEIALDVIVRLPPEVLAEIRHAGIYVSGDASTVYGLENYLSKKFDMHVSIADNPDMVIALGGGVVLGNPEVLKKVKVKFKI